jgi:hypothetical protein
MKFKTGDRNKQKMTVKLTYTVDDSACSGSAVCNHCPLQPTSVTEVSVRSSTRVRFILYFSYSTLYCRAIVYLPFDDRYRNIQQSLPFFYT